MVKEGLLKEIETVRQFFERSTDCLTEEDSGFAPKQGMYTASQHVAHAAQSIEWFIDGMFSPKGFDLNFEEHIQAAINCTSLKDAREWFTKAVNAAVETISSKNDDELQAAIAEGPIMGGAPRFAVVGAISEHTAHHRGALTIYSRLLGHEPKMPYGEF